MAISRRILAWAALGAVLLVLCYGAVHIARVHERSYEYRWRPTAAAPRIQFDGRNYLRGRLGRATTSPADEVPLGLSEGGGRIYGPPGARAGALTVIHVVAGKHTFEYALSGGP
jgi:hypothetical protein